MSIARGEQSSKTIHNWAGKGAELILQRAVLRRTNQSITVVVVMLPGANIDIKQSNAIVPKIDK